MARKNSKEKHKKYHDLLLKREKEREAEKAKKAQKKDEKDFFSNFKISLDDKEEYMAEMKEDQMEEEKKVRKVNRKTIQKQAGRPLTFVKQRLRKIKKNARLQRTAIEEEN
mmetsp:Transcript_13044/g.14975  ORF Transcript_13044/g.14975 Transcript_13044/m.14975 type:complete len:111 (+) Transcript_13044:31-363(+)